MHPEQEVIDNTKNWLESIVIGMNLCPFARKPYLKEQVKITIEKSSDVQVIFERFLNELALLDQLPPGELETTLLVVPNAFGEFDDYLDALEFMNSLIQEVDREGVYQLASFHPDYVFEGVDEGDVENFTNRSPYPVFHLIREESVAKALHTFPGAENIPAQNIEKMKRLSQDELKKLFYWRY